MSFEIFLMDEEDPYSWLMMYIHPVKVSEEVNFWFKFSFNGTRKMNRTYTQLYNTFQELVSYLNCNLAVCM
jgi:hypothetical protein